MIEKVAAHPIIASFVIVAFFEVFRCLLPIPTRFRCETCQEREAHSAAMEDFIDNSLDETGP